MDATRGRLRTTARRSRVLWAAAPIAGALIALAGFLVAPLAAQEEAGPNVGHLSGVVVDAVSGVPLEGALVILDDEDRATLTDSAGIFALERVPSGGVALTIRQYGYEAQGMLATVPPGGTLDVEVPLPPWAVLVDGVTVVADRIELMERRLHSRRMSVPSSARAFDQQRLVTTGATDLLEFVLMEAALHPTACDARGGWSWSGTCIFRRGRTVEPRVFIDEVPLIGGFDFLSSYKPYDLYLLEVYSMGQEIRAYTHQFMERMAVRPVALIPIALWP